MHNENGYDIKDKIQSMSLGCVVASILRREIIKSPNRCLVVFSHKIKRGVVCSIMSKRQQPNRNEKCQFNVIHGSSMNDEEILTPQGKLQLAPKHHYTQLHRKRYPYVSTAYVCV